MPNCDNCSITCSGAYKISEHALGIGGFNGKIVLQAREEQVIYQIGKMRLCFSCLDLLNKRGWLVREKTGGRLKTYYLVQFRDGSEFCVNRHWWNNRLQDKGEYEGKRWRLLRDRIQRYIDPPESARSKN